MGIAVCADAFHPVMSRSCLLVVDGLELDVASCLSVSCGDGWHWGKGSLQDKGGVRRDETREATVTVGVVTGEVSTCKELGMEGNSHTQ